MKSFSKTTLILISAVVLTAALCGAYAFFFIAMKNKTEATAALSEQNETLAGNESRIMSALIAIKSEGANIDKLGTYFIKESEVVAFTKKLELLGVESGTDLSLEALDPGLGANGASVLNFRLTATGEFKDVIRLMEFLENFPAKFEWKNVDLSRNDGAVDPKAPKAVQWKISASLSALNFIKE